MYNLVRIHQMENSEGESYDGGQKRDRIICLQRIDARDPRYIIIWSIDYRFGNMIVRDVRQ